MQNQTIEIKNKVFFERVTIYNFRIYHGENIFNFGSNEKKSLNFIKTGNSGGKTTLLKAILWCIWGGDILNKDLKDPEYISKGGESIVNLISDDKRCSVQINLKINDQNLLLTRALNLNESTKESFNVKNLTKPIGEQDLTIKEATEFINKYFEKEYFAFEGEKLETFFQKLFQAGASKTLIDNTILSLSKFDVLKTAKSYSNLLKNKIEGEVRAETTDPVISNYYDAWQNASEIVDNTHDAVIEYDNEIDERSQILNTSKSKLQREHPEINKDITLQKDEIEKDLKPLQKQLEDLRGNRNELLTNKFPQIIISELITDDDKKQTKLEIEQLEKNEKNIFYKEILDDISNKGSHEIPNSNISLNTNDSIQEWFESNVHLNLDKEKLDLNKDKANKLSEMFNFFQVNEIDKKELKDITKDIRDIKREISDMQLELANIGPIRVNEAIINQFKDIAGEENAIEELKEKKQDLIDNELKSAEKEKDKAWQEYQKITETANINELSRTKQDLSDNLVNATIEIYDAIVNDLQSNILETASKTYSRIWTETDDSFSIENKELALVIKDNKTGLQLGSPSAGHQQIAAISFLSSAFNLSSNQNPFIFDYIFARLDRQKQINLLIELPKLGHQFIISVLDSEPNWDDDPELFKHAQSEINKKYILEYNPDNPNNQVSVKEV